jgi:hypothetical protein
MQRNARADATRADEGGGSTAVGLSLPGGGCQIGTWTI